MVAINYLVHTLQANMVICIIILFVPFPAVHEKFKDVPLIQENDNSLVGTVGGAAERQKVLSMPKKACE